MLRCTDMIQFIFDVVGLRSPNEVLEMLLVCILILSLWTRILIFRQTCLRKVLIYSFAEAEV